MVRPVRLEFSGALYHVTARGNARQDIYVDDKDRRYFLNILSYCTKTYHWQCHAYCLMSNHYHLLIETGDATRGQAIQLRSVFHGRRSPVQTRLERAAGSHDLSSSQGQPLWRKTPSQPVT